MQADEQSRTATVREHRPNFGPLGGDTADRTFRQHVDDAPSGTRLSHHIGQHMRLAGGCHDLRFYHPIVAGGCNTGQDLEALARVVVEVGDVGRDSIPPKGVLQGRLLIRGKRSPACPNNLADNHLEVESPADHWRNFVVSLTEWDGFAGFHNFDQAGMELFYRSRHLGGHGGRSRTENSPTENELQNGAAIGGE